MEKAPEAFRTISEVAAEIDVPQHVLRFWESRFHEIRPMKRGGGRRFYRPQDIDLLRGIRHLLYGEGYTIRGVQRILREQGQRFVQNVWQPGAPQPTRSAADGASEDESDQTTASASAVRSRVKTATQRADDTERQETELEEGHEHKDSERGDTEFEKRDDKEGKPALAAAATPSPAAVPAHLARKLQILLDDLTDCRRLLESAIGPGRTD